MEQNISYCEGLVDQKLDVARPKASGIFPTIIFIHGGAWSGGSRLDYETELDHDEKYNLLKASAKRGFVAVTIDYRLTRDNSIKFPIHLNDVKCAIRWLKENSSKYQIDPNRIGLTGSSAGGHLALMAGLTPDSMFRGKDPLYSHQTSEVRAIVNWWGPSDIVTLYRENPRLRDLIPSVFGGNLPEAEKKWYLASPIKYLSEKSPPIQTIQGSEDNTIVQSQAYELQAQAQRIRASHELILCQGLGHGLEDPLQQIQKNESELIAFQHMIDFFTKNLY